MSEVAGFRVQDDDELLVVAQPHLVALADQFAADVQVQRGRRCRVLTSEITPGDHFLLIDVPALRALASPPAYQPFAGKRIPCDCVACRMRRALLARVPVPYDRACEACSDLGYSCHLHEEQGR